jgi:hypothetical protein
MEMMEMGACSFCEKLSKGLIKKGDLSICQSCVYYGSVVSGVYPAGAMYCHKCKDHEIVLKVNYENGSSATFAYYDLDSKGCPIYLAVESHGDWNLLRKPKRAICTECNGTLPSWHMQHNPTLRPKEK